MMYQPSLLPSPLLVDFSAVLLACNRYVLPPVVPRRHVLELGKYQEFGHSKIPHNLHVHSLVLKSLTDVYIHGASEKKGGWGVYQGLYLRVIDNHEPNLTNPPASQPGTSFVVDHIDFVEMNGPTCANDVAGRASSMYGILRALDKIEEVLTTSYLSTYLTHTFTA